MLMWENCSVATLEIFVESRVQRKKRAGRCRPKKIETIDQAIKSVWLCRFKTIAAADWRNAEMERRVLGMRAFIDHRFRRRFLYADLDEFFLLRMMLAKVNAQATLTIMNLKHDYSFE
jgi:hypothetical protein